MTKYEARLKLVYICEQIFEIESEMDINKSTTRKLGYKARIAVSDFMNAINTSKEEQLKDLP